MNIRGAIVFLLALTVCGAIADTFFYWRNTPVGGVPQESRKMVYDLLIFMTGVISGYIGKSDGK